MLTRTELKKGPVSIIDYRCTAGPAERPFAEVHQSWSVSYVRKGSFGYRTRGQAFELVAGSVLVGKPGEEFTCTHEHHSCGDECLAFHLEPEAADAAGWRADIWRSTGLPPLPELMVVGELAQAAAEATSDIGIDEIAWLFPCALRKYAPGGCKIRNKWAPVIGAEQS